MQQLKRILLTAFASILMMSAARAQYAEWGASIGMSHYFGDLNADINPTHPGGMAMLHYRKILNPFFAYRFDVMAGLSYYDSKWSSNPYWAYQNLNFNAKYGLITSMLEFNLFKFEVDKDKYETAFTPYVATGAGVGYFINQATYNGATYKLYDLRTEGSKYNQVFFCFPMEFGLKWRLAKAWTLAVHTTYIPTSTDYLDDVAGTYKGNGVMVGNNNLTDPSNVLNPLGDVLNKQRGMKGKDALLLTGISLHYSILYKRCPMVGTDPDADYIRWWKSR